MVSKQAWDESRLWIQQFTSLRSITPQISISNPIIKMNSIGDVKGGDEEKDEEEDQHYHLHASFDFNNSSSYSSSSSPSFLWTNTKGEFHNPALDMWNKRREEWRKPTVDPIPLPPRPPRLDKRLVRGLSSNCRTFELPSKIALPDLIDYYTDIWELEGANVLNLYK